MPKKVIRLTEAQLRSLVNEALSQEVKVQQDDVEKFVAAKRLVEGSMNYLI